MMFSYLISEPCLIKTKRQIIITDEKIERGRDLHNITNIHSKGIRSDADGNPGTVLVDMETIHAVNLVQNGDGAAVGVWG